MAKNARPVSLIIPSGSFDDGKPSVLNGHSSSSSIDSSSPANGATNNKKHIADPILTTTLSTTTTSSTESEIDSEPDDNLNSNKRSNALSTPDRITRRMKHFQKLFKSEITVEMPNVISSYACAYQGDILLQGKMYITDRYLCFHSRIISYVTKHVYRWEDIQCVTKERVAFIFPTAIGIQLKSNGKKVIYASFIQRDQAYEKVHLIWSRSTNEMHSFDDENEGTLKANVTNNRSNHTAHEMIDGSEQEDVLQMYLQEKHTDKRRLNSSSSKSSDERAPSQKRSSLQISRFDAKLSNGTTLKTNPTNRPSRIKKSDSKQTEIPNGDQPRVSHRLLSNHQNTNPSNHVSVSQSNPLPILTTTSNPSANKNTGIGLLMKTVHMFMSVINIILQYVSLLVQQLKSYPTKATIVLLLFIIILVFHSFYLIQLAYRIEVRLKSLYQFWPASSTSDSPPSRN